jgi:hypothetical protein
MGCSEGDLEPTSLHMPTGAGWQAMSFSAALRKNEAFETSPVID